MKIGFMDLLRESKDLVWGNKMEGFIAAVVPILLGSVVLLISIFIPFLNFLLVPLVLAGIVFMTTKMSLSVVRFKRADFNSSLQPFSGVLRLLGYSLLVAVGFLVIIGYLIYTMAGDEIIAVYDLIIDRNFIDAAHIETIADDLSNSLTPIIYITMLLNLLYTLKFFMVPYLIVDGNKVFDSFKSSWTQTKPYMLTIFSVTLFFILASEALSFISVIFNQAGALGALWAIVSLVFYIMFWLAYQLITPALLYNRIVGGVDTELFVEDPFEGNQSVNKTEWDF